MTRSAKPDRRVLRTREALLSAFRDLILERGYDRTTVGDIIGRANVGRSTFYEHFESKDELFGQSVIPLFSVLANTIGARHVSPKLQVVIAHLWDNRTVARVMMAGSTRRLMSRFLSELVEERLASALRGTSARPDIPLRLIAAHLAEAQLALLESWISNKGPCPPDALANALHASTNASATALLKRG